MDILLIAEKHAFQLREKRYWLNERRRLGKLKAPVTDWHCHKSIRLEIFYRTEIRIYADKHISTADLYAGLDIKQDLGI